MTTSKLIYQIPSEDEDHSSRGIVEAAPIREQIADILRKRIISGELANGEKLSERHISSELNVSTTPVKEAFRQLQAEGLIYTLPRKGSYVSVNAMEHMYQTVLLRSAVEGVAAYMAAKMINEDLYRMIATPILKAGRLIEEQSVVYGLISHYNDKFHEAIREASGDEQIISMGRNLFSIDRTMRLVVNRDSGPIKKRHAEHMNVLYLIRDGKCEEAERALVQHIRRANLPLFDKWETPDKQEPDGRGKNATDLQ